VACLWTSRWPPCCPPVASPRLPTPTGFERDDYAAGRGGLIGGGASLLGMIAHKIGPDAGYAAHLGAAHGAGLYAHRLALIAGSHLLIRMAFQHGVFGPRDTALVTPVLAMYAIQILSLSPAACFIASWLPCAAAT